MAKWNTQEDKNINYFETRYMYETRQKIYIANEETNQTWDETDIPDVIAAWNNNWSTAEIAEYLGADRKEMDLLIIDLIHQGKIRGNIHIFKPKRKGNAPMSHSIKVDDEHIRIKEINKDYWICLKDLWKYIKKPDHTYRKVTENWGPSERSKIKLLTPGGPQDFIFINTQGLDKLYQHVDKNQRILLETFRGALNDGLGISSVQQRKANKPRKGKVK